MDYQIGAVRLHQRSAQLYKEGQRLHCEPKIYALLLYLCQQPDRAVSRQELMEQVWQGRIVSDAAVNRAVAELRKLLEADPKHPVYLHTVSKLGYQLTGVQPCHERPPQVITPVRTPFIGRGMVLLMGLLLLVLLIGFWPRQTQQYRLFGAEPVTRLGGESFKAALQGRERLFFLHRAAADRPSQLWVQQGTEAKALTSDAYLYLDFALISEQQAVALRWSNEEERDCELVRLELTTGHSQPLSPCPRASANQLAYAKKSGWLFFNERPDISAPYAMHALHLETGQRRQLTQPVVAGNGLGDYLFALSAAENELLVLEYLDGQTVVLKQLDVQGRLVRQMPEALAPTSMHWVLPDQVLLTTAQAVYLLGLNDGGLQLLTQEAGWSRFRSAGPDLLLAERFDYLSQIVAQTFSGDVLPLYPQGAGRYGNPALSPQGTLAYVASDSQGLRLLRQPQGDTAVPWPAPEPLHFVSALSWSADGEQLLMAANDKLFLWQQERWQQLGAQFSQVHYAAFSSDGAVLFSALQQGIWRLFRLESAAHQPKLLAPPEGYSVQGPDHQGYYYYSTFSKPGLFRWRQGHDAELMVADFPVHGWRHWQLQGQQLLAQYQGSWWLQQLDKGAPQRLHAQGKQCRLLGSEQLVCEQSSHQQRAIWSLKLGAE